MIGTFGVRHLLTNLPTQTAILQWTLRCKTNGIAAYGFLLEYLLFFHHFQLSIFNSQFSI
jgi:hypothetical protein